MNSKDTIYIDVEDDITAIIGKVKAAGNKIVALVPPKRAGVLQSAVNLKLLSKAAASASKRVVLITNDHSLIALAAGVKIPVAKNLQSRPEIPHMEAPVAPEEEIIDGQHLPIGDVASSLGAAFDSKADDLPPKETEEKTKIGEAVVEAVEPESAKPGSKLASKVKSRIPNFNTFRKRLFLIGGGVVLLIIFIVWATVFAPRATVVITAKTNPVTVDKALTFDTALQQSDLSKLQIKPIVQQIKKSVATEFDATGTKDIGNKAKGTITVRNCDYADDELKLPVGTRFTGSNGKIYFSTEAVTVEGRTPPTSTCTLGGPQAGKSEVDVEAASLGPEYNVGSQTYTINVAGKIDGSGGEITGGTKESVRVVSQEDVDKARASLPQADQDAAKAELKKLFTEDQVAIDESFEVAPANVLSVPNVGEPASRAKLTQETTFTLMGMLRSETDTLLKTTVDDALRDKADQQAYGYGEDKVTFSLYQRSSPTITTARLVTTGFIGPKIDVDQLAKQLEGQRYGEIQAIVNNIPGIQNVSIDLSPFWVSRAPSADKIDIKFNIANG